MSGTEKEVYTLREHRWTKHELALKNETLELPHR
jgi:hypothetical protein